MSTPLHAFSTVIFRNVYFAIFILNIHRRKIRFSSSSQKSVSEKSVSGQYEDIFLNI